MINLWGNCFSWKLYIFDSVIFNKPNPKILMLTICQSLLILQTLHWVSNLRTVYKETLDYKFNFYPQHIFFQLSPSIMLLLISNILDRLVHFLLCSFNADWFSFIKLKNSLSIRLIPICIPVHTYYEGHKNKPLQRKTH